MSYVSDKACKRGQVIDTSQGAILCLLILREQSEDMGLVSAQTSPTVAPYPGIPKPEITQSISQITSFSSSASKFATLDTSIQGNNAQVSAADINYPSVNSEHGDLHGNLGANTHNNSESQYTKNLSFWSQIYKVRPGQVHDPHKANPQKPRNFCLDPAFYYNFSFII